MLRRATALKRICDRQRVQNAIWNRIGTVKHIMTDVFKTCKSQFKTL